MPDPTPPDSPRLTEWFGFFYGHDLGLLHAELLAIQHIPAALLKKEAALYRTKWFDYRRMHPTKATYLLAQCYNRAYQDCMSVMRDRSGKFMRGFKGMDFMESRERLSFWRLRQLIDSLGIRYDFFLRHAMNWHIEAGWLQPPRPSHLGSNQDMITDVMMAWEEECAARIQFPKDTRYKVANFFGHVDQLDWETFLVAQIKTRRHPQYALHSALYIEQTLRIEKAIEEFDERVIQSAIEECRMM
jgi:hypothetical protein